METFDDFNSSENEIAHIDYVPFAFREDKTEEGTLKWLNNNFQDKKQASLSRMSTYRRYHALFKGIHWRYSDTRDTNRDADNANTGAFSRRKPKQVVNFVWDMIESRVAQMSRLRSNIAVLPQHNEQSDINSAKGCKMLLDQRARTLKLDDMHDDADRIRFMFGHITQFVEWDPSCGPLQPAYKKKCEKEQNKLRKDNGGEDIHIGDVEVENVGPDMIFPQVGISDEKKMDELDRVQWRNFHELKKDYPGKEDKITANKQEMYNYDTLEISIPSSQIQVRTFYHRKTKYLPEGAIIKYTDDCILEQKPLHYEHGKIPCVHDRDITTYGEFFGRSFICNIDRLQMFYNNIQSATARDYGVAGAPKWILPKGSCDISSLNNELTIAQYKGAVPPKYQTHAPSSSQGFEVQDRLENKITKMSRIYDISRGDVPAGVTANSALRFLDEQESQTIIPQEKKKKSRVISVYKLMMETMAQFYDKSDGRTVHMLGKNNVYMMKAIKNADFNEMYDIVIENSSALPDSKTGKISAIIDLNMATQTDPIFRKEHVVEMLDLGIDDAFKDLATVSITAAGTILEMMQEGGDPPPPAESDNFLPMYDIFVKYLQSMTYRFTKDIELKNKLKAYVMTMEMLMYQRAQKNYKFLTQLAQVEVYPIFFTPEVDISQMIQPSQSATDGKVDTGKIKNINKTEGENK